MSDEDSRMKLTALQMSALKSNGSDANIHPGEHVSSSSSSTTTKSKRKARAWRKPKDQPRRPLSAYNLFFQSERKRLVAQVTQDEQIIHNTLPPSQRPHCRTSGIGFAGLARTIAKKWKILSREERSIFEEMAKQEKVRYKKEMKAWRANEVELPEPASLQPPPIVPTGTPLISKTQEEIMKSEADKDVELISGFNNFFNHNRSSNSSNTAATRTSNNAESLSTSATVATDQLVHEHTRQATAAAVAAATADTLIAQATLASLSQSHQRQQQEQQQQQNLTAALLSPLLQQAVQQQHMQQQQQHHHQTVPPSSLLSLASPLGSSLMNQLQPTTAAATAAAPCNINATAHQQQIAAAAQALQLNSLLGILSSSVIPQTPTSMPVLSSSLTPSHSQQQLLAAAARSTATNKVADPTAASALLTSATMGFAPQHDDPLSRFMEDFESDLV